MSQRWIVALGIVLGMSVVMVGAALQMRDAGGKSAAVAPSGSGVLAGQVVTDVPTPEPARRVTVKLEGESGTSNRLVGTDDDGRFLFDRLPTGRFTVSVSKAGYVTTYHGAKQPGRGRGVPVAVTDGARVDIVIKILPGGVITGVITDGQGQPAPGVTVAAVMVQSGGWPSPPPFRALTDDLGVYRIFSLPPGAYAVSAMPRLVPASEGRGGPSTGGVVPEASEAELRWARAGGRGSPPALGRLVSYAPVYYPGTTDPSAVGTVMATSGEERAGVDMTLRLVAMSRIAGRLLGASGEPVLSASVSLFPKLGAGPTPVDALVSSGALAFPRATVSSSSFTFTGLPPGEYTVVARTGAGTRGTPAPAVDGPSGLWHVSDLTVDGSDRNDVVLTLLPGAVLSGGLVYEHTTPAPPADLDAVELTLTGAPAIPGVAVRPRAVVDSAGAFKFANVPPGHYLLHAERLIATGTRWTLKSAILNGRDLADRPLDAMMPGAAFSGLVVTVTDNPTEVSGRLANAAGQPVTDYSIVVFTTDKTLWLPNARRVRAARPATDGTFSVVGLPAGDYLIAAAIDVEATDLADQAFLEQLKSSATPVALRDGEKKRQDFTLEARSDVWLDLIQNSSAFHSALRIIERWPPLKSARPRITTPQHTTVSPPQFPLAQFLPASRHIH